METILIIACVGAVNAICFFLGAKVGQTVNKGEPLRMPDIDPMKAVRERGEKKEANRQQERLDTILRNIDKYGGTERGQEDVQRR